MVVFLTEIMPADFRTAGFFARLQPGRRRLRRVYAGDQHLPDSHYRQPRHSRAVAVVRGRMRPDRGDDRAPAIGRGRGLRDQLNERAYGTSSFLTIAPPSGSSPTSRRRGSALRTWRAARSRMRAWAVRIPTRRSWSPRSTSASTATPWASCCARRESTRRTRTRCGNRSSCSRSPTARIKRRAQAGCSGASRGRRRSRSSAGSGNVASRMS